MPVPRINELSAGLFTTDGAALWLALAASAVIVDLIAGQYLTRHVPSADSLLSKCANYTIRKLDRPSRTLGALRLRGFIVIILLLPAAFLAGLWLNHLMVLEPFGLAITVAILLPLFGQKLVLLQLVGTGQQLGQKEENTGNDPYRSARTAAARAILDFTTTLVPRTLWWCLGGFALLLPQMLLAAFIQDAEKRRSGDPESPFFAAISVLYEVGTAPLAIIGAGLVALAHFFLPGTNLGAFKALRPGATFGPASRYFPLKVIALGLGLSLEAEIGEKTSGRKASDKEILWIGPDIGRAQLRPADLKKIWLIRLVALALYLVLTAMVFALLLQNISVD